MDYAKQGVWLVLGVGRVFFNPMQRYTKKTT